MKDAGFYVNTKVVRICLIILMIGLLAMIVEPSYQIYLYSQEPFVATGKLEKVDLCARYAIELNVNGGSYRIFKSPYSDKSFGIMQNLERQQFLPILSEKVGSETHIEYVKTVLNRNRIVSLVIDELIVIEKASAIRDSIEDENNTRILGAVLLICGFLIYIKIRAALKG